MSCRRLAVLCTLLLTACAPTPFEGDVTVGPDGQTSVDGPCRRLTEIQGNLSITGATTLEALSCVERVHGRMDLLGVQVQDLDELASLVGVSALFVQGGALERLAHPALGARQITVQQAGTLRAIDLPGARALDRLSVQGSPLETVRLAGSAEVMLALDRVPSGVLALAEGRSQRLLEFPGGVLGPTARVVGPAELEHVALTNVTVQTEGPWLPPDAEVGTVDLRQMTLADLDWLGARPAALHLDAVDLLTTLTTDVSHLQLQRLPDLTSLDHTAVPARTVYLNDLPALSSLRLSGPDRLFLRALPALTTLDPGDPGTMMASLQLVDLPDLAAVPDLAGLERVAGPVELVDLPRIGDLAPLGDLTHIEGTLVLGDLPALHDLDSLTALERIEGGMRIQRTGLTEEALTRFLDRVEVHGGVVDDVGP